MFAPSDCISMTNTNFSRRFSSDLSSLNKIAVSSPVPLLRDNRIITREITSHTALERARMTSLGEITAVYFIS